MRRVKKLPFQVPNCITKLPGGDMWHDSKTGDKVHVTKLKAHIDKHYGVPVFTVINAQDFPNESNTRRITALNLEPLSVQASKDIAAQIKEELTREARWDLKQND